MVGPVGKVGRRVHGAIPDHQPDEGQGVEDQPGDGDSHHLGVVIPPYMAILCLSIAIITLAFLIHLDYFLKSSHPFLVPILRHQVSVTTHGLLEIESPKEDEHKSSHNEGYIAEKVALSKDSEGDWSISTPLPSP